MGRSEAVRRLSHAREEFCGIGTRRAKLHLNRLAAHNASARAFRIALEIEDASTLGKKYGFSKWGYRSYERKHALIHELIELCREQTWEYGKHRNHSFGPRWIVYFHLPGCEQISFHCDLDDDSCIPDYRGEWDGQAHSTLNKLEGAVAALLKEADMPRGEIKDENGRVLGYSYGCSRGSTGPLCKACKSGKGEKRCDYKLRGGRTCNVYQNLGEDRAIHGGDESAATAQSLSRLRFNVRESSR